MSIEKIDFHYPSFSRQSIFDSEELTALELAARTAGKMNEITDVANGMQGDINSREKSDDITNKRKLSPIGDFSGTLLGKQIMQVLTDIRDSLSLSQTIIDMVNDRESIGTIFDGGFFTENVPPIITIEGGLF